MAKDSVPETGTKFVGTMMLIPVWNGVRQICVRGKLLVSRGFVRRRARMSARVNLPGNALEMGIEFVEIMMRILVWNGVQRMNVLQIRAAKVEFVNKSM